MMAWVRRWLMRWMGVPTCEEIEAFAYDYLEGRLEPAVLRDFERHLRGCGNCRQFVEGYRTVALPGALAGRVRLDQDFEARVIQFLRERHCK